MIQNRNYEKENLTLSIKMSPPEIKQNAPTGSDGGRAGICDVGGLI
jgi:hypothetical protein